MNEDREDTQRLELFGKATLEVFVRIEGVLNEGELLDCGELGRDKVFQERLEIQNPGEREGRLLIGHKGNFLVDLATDAEELEVHGVFGFAAGSVHVVLAL